MTVIKLRIQSLQDAANGIPLFEGINSEADVHELHELSIGIIEKGTVGGQDVVMFMMENNGVKSLVQITAKQFEFLTGALAGAQQRFSDEKAKRN